MRRLLSETFGLPAGVDEVYRRILPGSGSTVEGYARSLLCTPEELLADLAPLVAHDIVRIGEGPGGGVVHVASYAEALARQVEARAQSADEAAAWLHRIAAALPRVVDRASDDAGQDARLVDAEHTTGGGVTEQLSRWIDETSGDLNFLRPDQWRLPSDPDMAVVVGRAARSGRRVRAIYPARAVREAPQVLIGRAALGEQVRLLPEVPTRLVVVGTGRALLPDPLGVGTDTRLVLRDPTLVDLCTRYFELLWDRATTVPSLQQGVARPELRRLLLTELARGAQDEQIARSLGVSLRTVRRRVALLMSDLGVDTRFQAGVEATRRGWL